MFRRALVTLLALGCWVVAVRGETRVEKPFLGITHLTRTEDMPRKVSMHIVEIDLTAPGIAFKLTAPSGARETVRQTTLDYLEQEHAQVAINAHYFIPFPSTDQEVWLVGLAASNGNVYSDFEEPTQSYAIVARAPAIKIDESNRASIVHYGDEVALWNAVSGSAQVITDGVLTIPTYAGGLLTPGGPQSYSDSKSWYQVATARTLIGLSEDSRTLVLFTVDRAGGSLGLTVEEAAAILRSDYGVYNALNLDGGGSTTLAMEDPATHAASIVNVSSDNPKGRAVGSNLAVFAKPAP